jgi:hypothetical protein
MDSDCFRALGSAGGHGVPALTSLANTRHWLRNYVPLAALNFKQHARAHLNVDALQGRYAYAELWIRASSATSLLRDKFAHIMQVSGCMPSLP